MTRELDIMTDWYMDILLPNYDQIKFNYSRLFCDVERFLDDSKEIMAKHGMGVIYTKTHDGRTLKNVDKRRKTYTIKNYYFPHHHKLTEAVKDKINGFGQCLIIDCHSYDERVPWISGMTCPDICLGLNTPNKTIENEVGRLCQRYSYSFQINTPFSGSISSNDVNNEDVLSVMLEINKRIYMGEGRKIVLSNFQKLQEFSEQFVDTLRRIAAHS
jgi:N-formylglutamate amidohydrolase